MISVGFIVFSDGFLVLFNMLFEMYLYNHKNALIFILFHIVFLLPLIFLLAFLFSLMVFLFSPTYHLKYITKITRMHYFLFYNMMYLLPLMILLAFLFSLMIFLFY